MAETPSTFTLRPGAEAPDFSLPDGHGAMHRLADLAGPAGTLVVFVCNHCPFVVHLADQLGACAREIAKQGVASIAINSNDVVKYPADAPDKMLGFAAAHRWDFPYLFDESQQVARAYDAACTPDFFLFDRHLRLAYAGQFDNSRPGRGTADGADLREALGRMLAGDDSLQPWRPSTGCNIKWKG